MKKIIGILLAMSAMAFTMPVTAQKIVPMTKVVSNLPTTANLTIALDTVTNTGTNYLSGYTDKSAGTVTIQAVMAKLSGTPAGTVTLQGSVDGSNWVTVTGTATGVQTGAFTATNVTSQSTSWTLVGNPYPWYRVTWTGSGTMSCTLAGNIYIH
jgi:hypothetical protein